MRRLLLVVALAPFVGPPAAEAADPLKPGVVLKTKITRKDSVGKAQYRREFEVSGLKAGGRFRVVVRPTGKMQMKALVFGPGDKRVGKSKGNNYHSQLDFEVTDLPADGKYVIRLLTRGEGDIALLVR